MIDLRSDTVTRPSPAMREAMAKADVGDDVYGDDPTVKRLEARVAELLGKEDAVYMPTGSMTNQVAIRSHTESGDLVLMDAASHVVRSEGGGPAALSGVTAQRIAGDRGIFTAAQVEDALGTPHAGSPTTLAPPATLLCVENTHNGGGGSIWPLETLDAVVAAGRRAGLRCHLDGARVWNASAATGVTPARYARDFDSVSVCFSKALGAPVGSALCGSTAFVRRARRFKQLFGGGFRQAGVIAAGALYALEHHRDGLVHDHAKAGFLADVLVSIPGVELVRDHVETNILRFKVPGRAGDFVDACLVERVAMLVAGRRDVRAVMHRDVSVADVERAGEVVQGVLEARAGQRIVLAARGEASGPR